MARRASALAPQTTFSVSSNAPSLDIVLDLVRDQLKAQDDYAGSLDAKAGFILGSASLLTGVLVVFKIPLPVSGSLLVRLPGLGVVNWLSSLPAAALVIYLVIVTTAYMAYRLRNFQQVPKPNILASLYLMETENATKATVLATMLTVFNHNERMLDKKATWTSLAFGALWLEGLTVFAMLVVQLLR